MTPWRSSPRAGVCAGAPVGLYYGPGSSWMNGTRALIWWQPADAWGGLGEGSLGRSERRVAWPACTVPGERTRLSSGPAREHGLWGADPLHRTEAPEQRKDALCETHVKICSTKAEGREAAVTCTHTRGGRETAT